MTSLRRQLIAAIAIGIGLSPAALGSAISSSTASAQVAQSAVAQADPQVAQSALAQADPQVAQSALAQADPQVAQSAVQAGASDSTSSDSQVDSAAFAEVQPPKPKNDQLFRDLGGESGLKILAQKLVENFTKDPRVSELFVNTNNEYFAARLYEDLCVRTGGPCVYTGLSMHDAHSGMDIKPSEFNYFVEDAQKTMDALGIQLSVQNRLLKLLAGERKNVIRQ